MNERPELYAMFRTSLRTMIANLPDAELDFLLTTAIDELEKRHSA